MATQYYYGQPSSFYAATGGKPVEGAYYSGRRVLNGQLLAPGEHEPGKQVSNEVIAQTNPNNVAFIQQERAKADQIQAPIQTPTVGQSASSNAAIGLNAEVEAARKALETTLASQKAESDKKLEELKKKEQEVLGKVGELTTPFRDELETAQRESLYINKNFEENQKLVDELDQLLTEGNDLIRQQQGVTGLDAIRNPRIQKAMDDVAARSGVIQAVMSARNGQIAQAQNFIDRSINNIAADRNDQISYYETILNLNRQDLIRLDDDSKKIAEEQLQLKKNDLATAQASADYIKQLLINPATASLMGEAGVRLTDSVETINAKITQADYAREVRDLSNQLTAKGLQPVINPAGIPAKQLVTVKDSRGNTYYFKDPTAGGTTSPGIEAGMNYIYDGLDVNPAKVDVKKVTPVMTADLNDVLAPRMSPKNGIGSIYHDEYNRKWQYQSNGWVLLG